MLFVLNIFIDTFSFMHFVVYLFVVISLIFAIFGFIFLSFFLRSFRKRSFQHGRRSHYGHYGQRPYKFMDVLPYVLSSLWMIELSVQVLESCRRA